MRIVYILAEYSIVASEIDSLTWQIIKNVCEALR